MQATLSDILRQLGMVHFYLYLLHLNQNNNNNDIRFSV